MKRIDDKVVVLFVSVFLAVAFIGPSIVFADCPNNGHGDTILNTRNAQRPIFTKYYQLSSNVEYEWEIKSLTQGTNSVMRLFNASFYNTDYIEVDEEVGYDNSSGVGNASKITLTPEVGGYYLLVVHSSSGMNEGIGDLWFNGQLDESNIQIGGQQFYSCGLRNGDKMHSVFEPLSEGAGHHQMLVSMSSTGPGYGFRQDNSPSGGRGLEYVHNENSNLSYSSVIVASSVAFSGKVSHAYNDAINDDDNDGIGNLLEEAIGTCPNSSFGTVTKDGWECHKYSSIDSDHDGISDYDEYFGAPNTFCYTSPYTCFHNPTPLRWWGADPTQKDVFIEVNYELTDYASGGLKAEFKQSDMVGIYNAFSAASAVDIENPNGEPGVRLHFEVEDASTVDFPGNPAFVFFGNESGYNYFGGDDQGSGFVDNCDSYSTARSDSMLTRRKPFFRFMCANNGPGGKANVGGNAFRAKVTSPLTITHEVGHMLGLHHGGYDKVNGKPNYRSIMNYAFGSTYVFSSAESNVLNPTSLCEEDGLGSGVPYNYLSATPYSYSLLTWNNIEFNIVDWNRDGNFSGCNEIVRAPITWAPTTNRGLSALGQAQEHLSRPEVTASGALGTPSLARLEVGGVEMLYMFYSDGQHVRYQYSEFPNGCVNDVSNLPETACNSWSLLKHGHYLANSISTKPFIINGMATVIAVTTKSNGEIRILRYDPNPSTKNMSASLIMNAVGVADGEVAIEKFGQELIIVWKNQFGEIVEVKINSFGLVSTPQIKRDINGIPWLTNTAPAITINSNSGLLYMLRTRFNDRLEILERDVFGQWRETSLYEIPDTAAYATSDQPGFAWQPYNRITAPTGPGHFWIAFPEDDSDREVQAVRLPKKPLNASIGRMHHEWTNSKIGTSVELLHVEGEDNLKAVYIRPPEDGNDRLVFFPFADGVFDFDLRGANDFKIMATKICGGLGSDSNVQCGQLQGSPYWMTWYQSPVGNEFENELDCFVD